MTALNPYTITAGSYNSTTGYVTFTTSTSPGFVPGSEFTVSGMNSTGASVNQTYVAVAGTTQTGTTIVGNPISGAGGTPQGFASNPGTISTGSSPQLVSNILPGMHVLGAYSGSRHLALWDVRRDRDWGDWDLRPDRQSDDVHLHRIDIRNDASTLGSTPSYPLVVGQQLTSSTGSGFSATTIVALLTGSGASGSTYQVSVSQTAASGTITAAGTIGSSGSPVNIFAYTAFYYFTAVPSTNPSGGSVTAFPRANQGDFISLFGTNSPTVPSALVKSGWGGTIGNIAMLYGVWPQTTGGAPATTSLASLCKKTADIQSFAAANGMTVNSLYRLNDFSIYGDSGYATIQGYVTNTTGTNATLNVIGSPIFGSLTAAGSVTAKLTGVGLNRMQVRLRSR